MHDDPGLLPSIPGEFIAKAELSLPDVTIATEQHMTTVVDTGQQWQGVVRITCERTRLKKGKNTWWRWFAVHAEKV